MQSLSEEGITAYEDINDTHIRYTIKSLCWNNDITLKNTIKGPPSGCANDKYRSILWHSSSKAWRHTWQTLFNIRVVVKQVICCMEANEWMTRPRTSIYTVVMWTEFSHCALINTDAEGIVLFYTLHGSCMHTQYMHARRLLIRRVSHPKVHWDTNTFSA